MLQLMENRPFHEWAFHGPKGRFHPSQEHIGVPDLLRRQILTIGFQEISAIQRGGFGFLLRYCVRRELLGGVQLPFLG